MYKKLKIHNYLHFSSLFLLIVYYLHPIPLQGANVDIGYHLLLGEYILQNNLVPNYNFFSYTAYGFPYININWLSQVIFYKFFDLFGFNGLLILGIFLIVGTFLLLFRNVETKNKYFSLFLVSLLYLQILIDRTEVKPELFSLLFLSLYLFILYGYKIKPNKRIYLLPLIQLFWVNIHIFFIVGTGVTFLFFLDALIQNRYNFRNKTVIELGLTTLLSCIANLVNPSFIHGAIYPFTVFSNYGYKVIENYNIFIAFSQHNDITFVYLLAAALLLGLNFFIPNQKTKRINIFLIVFFSSLVVFAVRNISIYVVGTFIPCVVGIHYLIKKIEEKSSETKMVYSKVVVVCLTIVIILPGYLWAYSIHGFGTGKIDEAEDAVNLLKENNIQGPIYNNYNIGNYLLYKIYPQEKVFVNGSPEAYPKKFFETTYYPVEAAYETFEEKSKEYKYTIVFYDHVNQATDINPLLSSIITKKEWKLVFLNNRVVVFIKANENNKEFIQRHLITQENLKLKDEDTNTEDKLQNLSNLFRIFGWYEKMYEMDMRYLSYDPKNCIALRHVTVYMSNNNHPLANTYMQKLQENCKYQ